MANSYTSPNMNLTIPSPGLDPGPDWANNINASLTLIDAHDHSPGKGVQITPAGMNISSDLTFNSNNATALRSVRFFPFANAGAFGATAFDLGCLFEIAPDLYYIDGVGNKIRITSGGFVNSGAGSISGLSGYPNASASYNGSLGNFIFQQNINVAANIDVASIILRNATSGSNGLTLNPPPAMASNYSITLPNLPVANSVVTISPTGVMGTAPAGTFQQAIFTSSGTWTKASYPSITPTTLVKITALGGGAAGQNVFAAPGGIGGGGGGASINWVLGSSLGATETVTIGSGGPSFGAPGGDSSFGTWATGGGAPSPGSASIGGMGSNGLINIQGGSGFASVSAAAGQGGNGAGEFGGGGGFGVTGGAEGGGNYGGGGSGSSFPTGNYLGTGAQGIVVLEWTG